MTSSGEKSTVTAGFIPLIDSAVLLAAARRSFAVWLAAACEGPVFWIALRWQKARLNPRGLAPHVSPARFIFPAPKRPMDLLWCMEECLRSGAVPLVIADLPEPPPLTPVRRMHLAAEEGAQVASPPLGLILTPGDGGAPGVESRWHVAPTLAPTPDDEAPHWQLTRRRARTAPVKSWDIVEDAAGLSARPLPDRETP